MPTGYTHKVQTGAVTDFPTFALDCARAFGALVHMRDDASDAEIRRSEPSSYHAEAIEKATADLTRLRSMTPAEIGDAYRAAQKEAEEYRREYEQRKAAEAHRYRDMIAKAAAWEPPTADHRELKTFMLSQLRESLEFDCGGSYSPSVPYEGAQEWWQTQVKKAQRDVDYHRTEQRKEEERCRERNEWVDQLRASLAPRATQEAGR